MDEGFCQTPSEEKDMKTTFLVISRGLVCRNLLRTGVIEYLLKEPDSSVVLLFPKRSAPLPDYLFHEFSDERIHIEEIEEHSYSPFMARIWIPFVNNFVYSRSTNILARDGSAKVKPVPRWWYPFHRILFSFLSKFDSLKSGVRFLEKNFFVEKRYDDLFRQYTPSAVLVGSILSKADVGILKAAARHGVKSYGMQKGWDNLERLLLRVVPDKILVQNRLMVEAAQKVQRIPSDRISIVGFPQFDQYVDFQPRETREMFLTRRQLPLDTKLFFFGSEGAWSPNDADIIRGLLKLRNAGAFPFPVAFIIRPYFSDIKNGRFNDFRETDGVILDDGYRWGAYFPDLWDPTREDMQHFTAELYFADAVLCVASTLSLDAVCMDKPVIAIGFGAYIDSFGKDLTGNLYKMEHYRPVVESGGVELVTNEKEMCQALIRSVEEPSYRAEGRTELRRTMCGPLDGHSAERIAKELIHISKTSV